MDRTEANLLSQLEKTTKKWSRYTKSKTTLLLKWNSRSRFLSLHRRGKRQITHEITIAAQAKMRRNEVTTTKTALILSVVSDRKREKSWKVENSYRAKLNRIDMNKIEFTWSGACSLTRFLIICFVCLQCTLFGLVCMACCRRFSPLRVNWCCFFVLAFIQSKSITMASELRRHRSCCFFLLFFFLLSRAFFRWIFLLYVQLCSLHKQVNSRDKVHRVFSSPL